MKTILLDSDYLIYTICSALEPYFYYVGSDYYRTRKKAIASLKDGQFVEDIVKEDFRVPPTAIRPICVSIVKAFQQKIRRNLLGTEWEGVKELYFFNSKTNFRKEFCKVYKSTRRDKPFYHDRVKDWLIKELAAIVVEGFEADDTVAVFAELQRGKGLLVHCDKDLNNIPCTHYDFMKETLYKVSKEQALESLLVQLITGDKTDDIMGFVRAGVKKAEKCVVNVPFCDNPREKSWLPNCWTSFMANSKVELKDKYTPEEVEATILHTLPLVDVGGYWSRRLAQLQLVQTVVDYRPILNSYKNLGL